MSDELVRRHELLAAVAAMYYLEGLDQNAIADRVRMSRSTVSRMITEARQSGIVRIQIDRSLPRDGALEAQVRAAFPVRDAIVVTEPLAGVGSEPIDRVGLVAAQHLESVLPRGGTLAISWGIAVSAVAEALERDTGKHVRIVQILGASGSPRPSVDGPEVARRFAEKLGGESRTLHTPLVLDDEGLAAALLRQPSVAAVLAEAARADVALIGLGGMSEDVSSLLRAGFASPDDLRASVEDGAVGDASGHMLAADGRVVTTSLSRRMVRLDERSLRAIPEVLAVAVGLPKVPIIRAALLSGIVDVIATDAATITAVLDGEAADERRGTEGRDVG